MKKIWIVGCVVLFLTGCSQKTTSIIKDENTYYSYVDKISSDNIQKLDVSAELVNEYTPQYMKSISDAVVIGRVDSIDSADMEYNQVVGYTYGTITIQNVLYGNMQIEDKIEYAKPGGIIQYTAWSKAQPVEDQEKRAYLSNKNNESVPEYVDILLENDIHIEAGKSYLMYVKYSQDMKKYEIVGLGNGLREIEGTTKSNMRNIDDLMIKNNNTQANESLTSYVDAYLK